MVMARIFEIAAIKRICNLFWNSKNMPTPEKYPMTVLNPPTIK